MASLGLSVLFSSLIFIIFKLFTKFKIQTLYAIITNYITACCVGLLFYNEPISLEKIPEKSWFWGTLCLGVLFILVFNLIAYTAQKIGVSVASVATKMSFVIPVLFSILLYQENVRFTDTAGIFLALIAVYLTSEKKQTNKPMAWSILLPILVFIGSGLIDAGIKYFQEAHMEPKEYPLFSATVFAAAGFTGLLFILIKAKQQPLRMNSSNIIAGVCLGIPNYFSIYFLLKALQQPSLTSAAIFTINNVAIVMLSTLLSILLFKEVLNTRNWIGIGLAVTSIVLVAFEDLTALILQSK